MAKLSFALVDHDRAAVADLKDMVNTAFPESQVYISYDGIEGWDIIQKEHPSIVIADADVPGYNAVQLCEKIRALEELDDIFFIILTRPEDRESRLDALDKGADDFLMKPVSSEGLVARLISASRYISLKSTLQEENQLLNEFAGELEQDIQDMINVCVKFLQARMPASKEMLRRVALASVWMSKHLDVNSEEQREIDIAAQLSYAGKISLPDDLLKLPILIDGRPTHNLMYQVPGIAREIVAAFRRFDNISAILYHLYENFDGSGFPNKLKKWQIPIGSRIIRVALDYEEARFLDKKKPKFILNKMKADTSKYYDHRIVTLLEQYLAQAGEADSDIKERAVQLRELHEGMVLSRDVFTNSGLKLFTEGTVLTEKYIERVLAHNTSDPILGHIIIRI